MNYRHSAPHVTNSPETVQDAANRLAAEIAEATVRALVIHRSQALVTGKLSIKDEQGGFRQEVDFGRRSDHTATATNGWDNSAADPQ